MAVPPRVRAALVTRVVNSDDVLGMLEIPVLMSQGSDDKVILPAMGNHILKVGRTSVASWFSDIGHAPFMENPTRFNRELAKFARDSKASSMAA